MRTLAFSLLAAASMTFAGCDCCQKQTTAATVNMGAVNSACPISGRSVEGGPIVDYNGSQVGFCCNGCANGWNNKPDAEKQTYLDSQK